MSGRSKRDRGKRRTRSESRNGAAMLEAFHKDRRKGDRRAQRKLEVSSLWTHALTTLIGAMLGGLAIKAHFGDRTELTGHGISAQGTGPVIQVFASEDSLADVIKCVSEATRDPSLKSLIRSHESEVQRFLNDPLERRALLREPEFLGFLTELLLTVGQPDLLRDVLSPSPAAWGGSAAIAATASPALSSVESEIGETRLAAPRPGVEHPPASVAPEDGDSQPDDEPTTSTAGNGPGQTGPYVYRDSLDRQHGLFGAWSDETPHAPNAQWFSELQRMNPAAN